MNDVSGKVKAPAIALIVVAAIGIVLCLLGLILSALGLAVGLGPASSFLGMTSTGEQEQVRVATMPGGTLGLLFRFIMIGIGIFIILAAMRMLAFRSYGMCIAASILAMIPCISPCCWLGLPVGIWALVVLLSQDVKAAFAEGGRFGGMTFPS